MSGTRRRTYTYVRSTDQFHVYVTYGDLGRDTIEVVYVPKVDYSSPKPPPVADFIVGERPRSVEEKSFPFQRPEPVETRYPGEVFLETTLPTRRSSDE